MKTQPKSTEIDLAQPHAVELPPNKAIAAGGSAGIGSVIVGLGLYYLDHNTPPEIVGLWTALANTLIATAAVYFMPHGAYLLAKKDN